VFAARRVVSSNLMVMHARRRDDDGPARAAVVAGKGVGNAVRRNRAKRRLRGALTGCTAARGLDVVVIARPGVHDVPFAQLRGDLQALLDAAGRRP
jgi:ribonuclease P protein component